MFDPLGSFLFASPILNNIFESFQFNLENGLGVQN